MLRTKNSRIVLFIGISGVLTQHLIVWIAGIFGFRDWARLLRRGDGTWYLWIAENGYSVGQLLGDTDFYSPKSDYVFYPMLPGLARVISVSGLSIQHSAMLVTSASTVIAAVLLHRFLLSYYSTFVSIAVPAMWVFQPFAVVLISVLTESLFALLSILTLHAVLNRNYLLAIFSVIAVSLTRTTGAAIAVTVFTYVLYETWQQHKSFLKLKGEELALLFTCLISPLLWPAYVATQLGRWDAYFYLQGEQWNSRFDGGISFVKKTIKSLNIFDGEGTATRSQIIAISSVVVLLLLLLLILNREPLLIWLPTLGVIAMAAVQAGWFSVKQRFFVPAFFLFIPVAKWLETQNVFVRAGTAGTFLIMTVSMTWWISIYYMKWL